MKRFFPLAPGAIMLLAALTGPAAVSVVSERHDVDDAHPGFRFSKVPPPSVNDAASSATLEIIAGRPDRNSASLAVLQDGRVPVDADQPGANFSMNWVTESHQRELVPKLNAAAREGRYREELWVELTGKTVQELGDEWKREMERRLANGGTAP